MLTRKFEYIAHEDLCLLYHLMKKKIIYRTYFPIKSTDIRGLGLIRPNIEPIWWHLGIGCCWFSLVENSYQYVDWRWGVKLFISLLIFINSVRKRDNKKSVRDVEKIMAVCLTGFPGTVICRFLFVPLFIYMEIVIICGAHFGLVRIHGPQNKLHLRD